jgi:hypothetical protein
MRLFKIVGNWVRGLYLMGLGGFWLVLAYYFSGLGEFGPGKPTIIGLSVLGGLFFFSGIVIFVRGLLFTAQRAPLPKEAAGWRDDGGRAACDTGYDADAAIARYLERRPDTAAAAAVEAAPQPPPRPTFGRKQA